MEYLSSKGGIRYVNRVGQWLSCRLDVSVGIISVTDRQSKDMHKADFSSCLSVSADGSLSLNVARL